MKSVKVLFVAAVIAAMAACGGAGSANTPEATALNFMKAFTEMDFATAKKLGTKQTGELLGMMESMMAMAGQDKEKAKEEFKKTMGSAKLTKATCVDGEAGKKKCTICCDENGKDTKETIDLVNEGGKWLVDMNKENMGGGSTEPMPSDSTTTIAPADTAAVNTAVSSEAKQTEVKKDEKKEEKKK